MTEIDVEKLLKRIDELERHDVFPDGFNYHALRDEIEEGKFDTPTPQGESSHVIWQVEGRLTPKCADYLPTPMIDLGHYRNKERAESITAGVNKTHALPEWFLNLPHRSQYRNRGEYCAEITAIIVDKYVVVQK